MTGRTEWEVLTTVDPEGVGGGDVLHLVVDYHGSVAERIPRGEDVYVEVYRINWGWRRSSCVGVGVVVDPPVPRSRETTELIGRIAKVQPVSASGAAAARRVAGWTWT